MLAHWALTLDRPVSRFQGFAPNMPLKAAEALTMARNIEIKARIDNIEALESKVAKIADNGPTEIVQDDTFFHCEAGRLKLRVFSEKHGELIFYRRAN